MPLSVMDQTLKGQDRIREKLIVVFLLWVGLGLVFSGGGVG